MGKERQDIEDRPRVRSCYFLLISIENANNLVDAVAVAIIMVKSAFDSETLNK